MGTMAGRQRKSYVRFLLMALRDARNEPSPKNKLDEMIDIIPVI